uniref:EF-hand domain-containing protein n=1 Tax=Plectus sambesii TaxID=2011161 RepID=A0A914VSM2_9BILA
MRVVVLLALMVSLAVGHQQASFPGQDAQQPPQQHHQAQAQQHQQPPPPQQQQQMHQQPAPGHANQPAANTHQFGGDEAQNAEHIKEHLDGKVDPTANMTPEQLQFHYFNMHDLDKNGRLDGIELIKAITHFHGEDNSYQPPLMPDNELEQMIDSIMKEDDFNNDGYIDYGEFLRAQKQRDEVARQHQQQQQQNPPPPPK